MDISTAAILIERLSIKVGSLFGFESDYLAILFAGRLTSPEDAERTTMRHDDKFVCRVNHATTIAYPSRLSKTFCKNLFQRTARQDSKANKPRRGLLE
jgi:hypothetical protein